MRHVINTLIQRATDFTAAVIQYLPTHRVTGTVVDYSGNTQIRPNLIPLQSPPKAHWATSLRNMKPARPIGQIRNALDENENIVGIEYEYRHAGFKGKSTYRGQFLSDWEELKIHDKARPAFDPSKAAADRQSAGITKDGKLRKFSASQNYLNWPTNRCKVRQDAKDHLDYNDINPIDPDYWEQKLSSEGLPAELDELPSSEFNKLEEDGIFQSHSGQSMTGVVCDRLALSFNRYSEQGPQSLNEQYKVWLHAVKKVAYASDIQALETAVNPQQVKLVQAQPNRPLRVKKQRGINKREQLLAIKRQAKDATN